MGYEYKHYSGPPFFVQDDSNVKHEDLDPVPPRFGLEDTSAFRWTTFWRSIKQLNRNSDGSKYKVFFLGRHGNAVHNVAMQKHKDDWKTTWSVLNGDGNLTWGPDPELVQDGYTEADSVHSIWTTELGAGLRMPRTNYCSPLTRCLVTNTITFSGFPNHAPPENSGTGPPHGMPVPLVTVVVENCREKCGKETPEKRRSKTYIQEMFPHFAIEDGFTELDELWHTDESETDTDVRKRVRNVLDGIFDNKSSGDFISITTHAGFIKAFLEVIKRDSFSMHPGAVLPVIVCRYTDDESDDS